MIHAIRKLAREIHRRSVWQVVGVYLVLAWLSVEAVGWATDVIGLPSWTPTMALVLAVVLFPIVVATAVVQAGLPGLRIQDVVDPNELEGLTPEQVHVVPEAHPLHGIGLLTWRNTILGAMSGAALLVASVVAYLVMWALGVGPVGSLRAQGLISEGDSVVVAEFINDTDDPSLAALATDLFEGDLARTTVVTVVGSDAVERALARAGEEGAVLDGPLARRVALREGIRAVVEGDVEQGAEGFRASARIVLARSGATVGSFTELWMGDEEMVPAIARLAERVRLKLGESLRAIRQEERLLLAVPTSDEALQLYAQAGRATDEGDAAAAIRLLEVAVGIDPSFALAWRKLGIVREQLGDTTEAREAYQRAIDSWTDLVPGGRRTVRELRQRIADLQG